jgi:hypothetical protein
LTPPPVPPFGLVVIFNPPTQCTNRNTMTTQVVPISL